MPKDTIAAKKRRFIKPITIASMRGFFKGLVGIAAQAAAASASQNPVQWAGMASSITEVITSFGFEEDSKEAVTWNLLSKAMGRAMYDIVIENRHMLDLTDSQALRKATDSILKDGEFFIDADFFEQPQNNAFVATSQNILREWLLAANAPTLSAASIASRLPGYFVYALHEEWRKDSHYYQKLQDYFTSPFFQLVRHERDWERYMAWLAAEADKPVFGSDISLRKIYVHLCACYRTRGEEEKDLRYSVEKKVVVELEKHLEDWLEKGGKDDAIRVVCGGPGCGKSSFAKLFAARLAQSGRKTLFIPLHLLNLSADLGDALRKSLKDGEFFDESPYEKDDELIIFFDGLDELAQQGKACVEVAKQFFELVQSEVSSRNQQRRRLQVILTGRELVVQTNEHLFRKQGQLLTIFPYFVPENERHWYADEGGLLRQDKRDIWWGKYGEESGNGYTKMPEELRGKNLDELTTQPLLNYLVALSYEQDTVEFTTKTTRNEVYHGLIKKVYQRGWDSKVHKAIRGQIGEEEFFELLEEIAICAWQGAGRITTVSAIETRCAECGIRHILDNFEAGAKAGVTNLLTAFYFRHTGIAAASGEKTFEFTHKSFGEYLLARRLVRQIQTMQTNLAMRKETKSVGWSEKDCLRGWGELCGQNPLDSYIFDFLTNETALAAAQDKNLVEAWQKCLWECINYALRNGIPMEALPKESFAEADRHARNAEEALLACLNACSRVTGLISKISWPADGAAAHWLSRLRRIKEEVRFFPFECLSFLDMSEQNFTYMDFVGAHLKSARLQSTSLFSANLAYAHLTGAHLERAFLVGANLQGAHLQGAHLEGANLQGADLQGASLEGANLEDADLENVRNLEKADLQGAIFKDARNLTPEMRDLIKSKGGILE